MTPRIPPILESSEVNVKNTLLINEKVKIAIHTIIKIVIINFTALRSNCQLH